MPRLEAALGRCSGLWLGAAHAGLVFLVAGAQARTETGEALPNPWWCAPLYHAGQFLGWRLAAALAALRLAVLASPLLRTAPGPGAVGGAEGGYDHGAAAVDDLLKILAFYVGLLLLSPFWNVVSLASFPESTASPGHWHSLLFFFLFGQL